MLNAEQDKQPLENEKSSKVVLGRGQSSSSNNENESKSRSRSRSLKDRRSRVEQRGKDASSDESSDENKSRSNSPSGSKHYHHKRSSYKSKSGRPKVHQPGLNGPLITFKTFMEMQHENIEVNEAQKFYDEYKIEHQKKQAEIFYQMHHNEPWFREKYDPEQSYKLKQEIMNQSTINCHKFIESFVENLDSDANGLCLDENMSTNYQNMIQEGSNEVSKPPIFGFDANLNTLYLKQIPINITRWDILNKVKSTPGFVILQMSEPLKTQNFVRYCWITYDNEENCRRGRDLLEKISIQDFNLSPVKSSRDRKPIRITPPLAEDSIERDLDLCKRLVSEIFDVEKKIDFAYQKLIDASRNLTTVQQLDLYILYLRRVHSFCFYCGEEFEDERMLASKCGPQHLRNSRKLSREDIDFNLNYTGSKTFEEKYLQAGKARINQGPIELKSPEEDQILKDMKQQYTEKKTMEVQKGNKYKCKICDKLFKGPEFVSKHIAVKHCEMLDEKFNKNRYDDIMKENYLNDPNKFINQPSQGYSNSRDNNYRDRRYQNDYKSRRYDDRGGDRHWDKDRDERKQKEYVDHDDPTKIATQNTERQIVSYDDLF